MKWRLMFLLGVCAQDTGALPGVVETRDGRRFDGQISLRSNCLVIADVARVLVSEVSATNLLLAAFTPPAPHGSNWLSAQLPPDEDTNVWSGTDVGVAQRPGSDLFESGVHRLASGGTNILGDCDAFRFVYRRIQRDTEIVARVLKLEPGVPGVKAGLMMRESLEPEAVHVFLGITTPHGGVFQHRDASGGETEVLNERQMFVPHWLKLRRRGDTVAAFRSRNGQRWQPVARATLSLPANLYVGLAVTGGDWKRSPGDAPTFARVAIDGVQEGVSLRFHPWIPRAQLTSGSIVAGNFRKADDELLHFAGPLPRAPVPVRLVSNLQFQWVPYRFRERLAAGRPGVILTTGEFLDGEFRALADGQVQLSSVLFGPRWYDANNDVIAVVLRRAAVSVGAAPGGRLRSGAVRVSTVDGCIWQGTALEIARDEIVLRENSLGPCRIAIYDLTEIRVEP